MASTEYIALLRAINVGTGRKVPMADLRALLADAGATGVETYIQSGNVVFAHEQDDEAALRADFDRARAHGFGAKLCIHPRQIAAVHALLAPSADELAWAQRVLAAAEAAGGAAVQLDGKMIDKPVIERARRLVQRAH